jgi:hypothetical protein
MINTELIAKIHQFDIAQTYTALETRPAGLHRPEVEARSRAYGKNTIREVKGKPLYVRFLANFVHVMAILLWVGGGMAFIAQMPNLGIAVWMVNIINGIFSFWQEFRAEKATQALRQLLPQRAHVLRDGAEQDIPVALHRLHWWYAAVFVEDLRQRGTPPLALGAADRNGGWHLLLDALVANNPWPDGNARVHHLAIGRRVDGLGVGVTRYEPFELPDLPGALSADGQRHPPA